MDKKALKVVIGLLFFVAILLLFFMTDQNLVKLLAIYVGMVVLSIIAFWYKDLKEELIGIGINKSLYYSIGYGLIFGGLFYLATRVIPGFSIGIPFLPQSISDQARKFIVLFFAPVVETIFFQGAVFGILYNYVNKTVAFLGQAVLFASFHIGAYVTGIYQYPNLGEGLLALGQNLGAFISAFIFALVCMFLIMRKRINNLTAGIVFHFIVNLIVTTMAIIIFA